MERTSGQDMRPAPIRETRAPVPREPPPKKVGQLRARFSCAAVLLNKWSCSCRGQITDPPSL